MRIKIENLIEKGFEVQVGEVIDDNNYPIYAGYNYVYKNEVIKSDIFGTLIDFKLHYKIPLSNEVNKVYIFSSGKYK